MKRKNRITLLFVLMFFVMAVSVPITPVQAYGGSTHKKMNKLAVDILKAKFPNKVTEISNHLSDINEGNLWADNEDENPYRIFHYHDPITHLGLEESIYSAGLIANLGMSLAETAYANGDISKAYFWVGFALHHVQDLTVPAHADVITCGVTYHVAYETYCGNHLSYLTGVTGAIFTFSANGAHHNPATAFGWVDYAAHKSSGYWLTCLSGDYETAAKALMPFALKLTAGFLLFAYHSLDPTVDVDDDGWSYEDEIDEDTLPWDSDTDNDGLLDGDEAAYNCNPLDDDSDNDGLEDGYEVDIGTNPRKVDTDGDGWGDGTEVLLGYDPTDPNSTPPTIPPINDPTLLP